MNTFSGLSFIVPMTLSFAAFVAWMVVAKRMTNLSLPWYQWTLTYGWALAILTLGVVDLRNQHIYQSTVLMGFEITPHLHAIGVVSLKTVIHLGILILAIVRYREIGIAHPARMAYSPFEDTPTGSEAKAAEELKTIAAIVATDLKADAEVSAKALRDSEIASRQHHGE